MAPTSAQARMAVHKSWANTADRRARTAPARAARQAKFEQQVDPDGKLSPAERAIRAEHARKAHYTALSLRAAEVRRSKKLAAASARGDRPTRGGGTRRVGLDLTEGSAA